MFGLDFNIKGPVWLSVNNKDQFCNYPKVGGLDLGSFQGYHKGVFCQVSIV